MRRVNLSGFLKPDISLWSADGLTLSGDAIDTDTLGTTIWIAGGEPGNIYTIANRIDTAQGRIVERSFKLEVQNR